MGHLLETTKKMASDEAHAAYDGGWQPGGVPLMAEPTEAELQAMMEAGPPGGIVQNKPISEPTMELRPLPSIGHIVLFHLRDGDSRNRRSKFPAIVMAADEEQRELELMVIVDATDTWMQERVRERVAPEQGWERIPSASPAWADVAEALVARLAQVEQLVNDLSRQVFGNYLATDECVLERLAAIENHPALSVPDLARGVQDDGAPTATTVSTRRKRRG